MSRNGSSNKSMGIMSILQIIFIVLKIVNVIDWPWWKVFIPFYISLSITLLLLIILWIEVNKK